MTHCQAHTPSHTLNEHLTQAHTLAKRKNMRFTPLREAVYRLILSANRPLGAYDLMSALQQEKTKKATKAVAPPTIYRSLEFLIELGLVHQLNSINAFVPCCHPSKSHVAGFLICENCRHVQEISELPFDDILQFSQQNAQFIVKKSTIELQGICHDCQ